MSPKQMDRYLDQLDRELAEGTIDQREYNRAVRELERDYREAAEEQAREAYRRELERW